MNRREPRRISKAGFLLPLPTTEDRAQNNASGAPNATSFCTRCPEGTNENRPAFQRRVEVWETSVPKGRVKRPLQTSLRDSVHVLRCPGVETPGYCQTSLRDNQTEKLVALAETAALQDLPTETIAPTVPSDFVNSPGVAARSLDSFPWACNKSRYETHSCAPLRRLRWHHQRPRRRSHAPFL